MKKIEEVAEGGFVEAYNKALKQTSKWPKWKKDFAAFNTETDLVEPESAATKERISDLCPPIIGKQMLDIEIESPSP